MDLKLQQWLKDHDVRLFLNRMKLDEARADYNALPSGRSVSAREFRLAVSENCQLWKSSRRRRVSHASSLDEFGWESLKQVVIELRPLLSGVSLAEAVDVVRTRRSCNAALLQGLPSRLQVWNSKVTDA